jgi:hypothetical protein
MELPKIGEVIYGFSDKQSGRIGETMFLCSTQENCTKDLKRGIEETVDQLTHSELEDYIDGDWAPVIESEREKDLIVWEMKRIK